MYNITTISRGRTQTQLGLYLPVCSSEGTCAGSPLGSPLGSRPLEGTHTYLLYHQNHPAVLSCPLVLLINLIQFPHIPEGHYLVPLSLGLPLYTDFSKCQCVPQARPGITSPLMWASCLFCFRHLDYPKILSLVMINLPL